MIQDKAAKPPFTLKNIRDLYSQYTEETNQPFTEKAVKKVFDETAGQPWLVNRLGTILTINIKPETINSITEEDVEKGLDILLYEENSHFDNITEKARQYKETFIEVVFDGVEYIPGDEEVTGNFQLTAWLYQFVSEGKGELYYESRTGLGIMDIMLIYKGKKYIIETKVKRYCGTVDEALEQLAEKYLLPERVSHGYIVLFDPKSSVGELCTPQKHILEGKEILSFNIGIGR
ncbi:MAG: hypothetical protein J7K84_04850 [Deltaproteobacteria bacterium]|nr:hypothetical protein [Deltaproteobacteria bacterium]